MQPLVPSKENSFCSFPWNGAQIHVSGQVRPCCMMDDLGIDYQPGLSVKKALNTPQMTALQEKLLQGLKPHECRACYEEDSMGVSSVRLSSPSLSSLEAEKISLSRSEISFTNSCNLDCVMCRPEFSTKVSTLYKEFYEKVYPQPYTPPKTFNIAESDALSLFEQFRDSDSVRLIGGEPLMSKAGRKFIQLWSEHQIEGYLDIVTNGTHLDEDLLTTISKCKNVCLSWSIDGYGKTYEWIRGYPWEEIAKKILLARTKVHLILIPTISVYNLLNLPELAQFCQTNDLRLRLGHVLRHPHHLSAWAWPRALRLKLAENFKELWGLDHEDLISFLRKTNEFSDVYRTQFHQWTHFIDSKRGFKWSDIDPRHNHTFYENP